MTDDAEVVSRLRAAHDAAPVITVETAPVVVAARRRRRRRALGLGAGVVAVVALTGLGFVRGPWASEERAPVTGESPPVDASPLPTNEPVSYDPVGLIGLWRVSAAVGDSSEAWLWLGRAEEGPALQLWRPCGWSYGTWDAGQTAFLGAVGGLTEGCAANAGDPGAFTPEWLARATGFALTADGWELLDAAGARVATLHGQEAPAALSETPGGPDAAPVITDAARATFEEPEPLPAELTPATTEVLLGRWVPAEGTFETDPNAVFLPDRWTTSDGCNMSGARWLIGGGGRLFQASDMGTTAIGCDGVWIPMHSAARLGFDGDELVLLDDAGTELMRLVRD